VTVVKPVRNFTQIKMEEFVRHTPVGIEPMFGIAPEAFNAIYMLLALRFASSFSDHHMVAADSQGSIGVPFVSVV